MPRKPTKKTTSRPKAPSPPKKAKDATAAAKPAPPPPKTKPSEKSQSPAPPKTKPSTKSAAVATPSAARSIPTPLAEPKPPQQTSLTPADLEAFRKLLLDKRSELVGNVRSLEDGALNKNGTNSDNSHMPIHMADVGSDTWEQDFALELMATERELLREIDAALERIENKTFGVCEATGQLITKARLLAKPWARYCIEYARQKEKGLVR